jgi:diadenosine tetraphosphatase ApaH/serine/threonine PP2A family protein phosphatase
MQALISDIHSNLEALSAVLRDIKERGIKDVICLGDVIGYGPNPRECVDIASKLRLCLLGNHEEAVLHVVQAQGFNRKASSAVRWTAEQFDMLGPEKQMNASRWNFLGALLRHYKSNGVLLVHGSPCDPTREYIHVADVRNPNKMERIFARIEHVCFVGHTHVPGAWTQDLNYSSLQDLKYVYHIDERKVVINVGSVGQPRDYDPRACYVVFDGETVRWIRVPYDHEKTIQKIHSISMLDDSLGERLREGR